MIAIIDYKAGNLTSVQLALESLGQSCKITDDAKIIGDADRVIFPGDGAALSAMNSLRDLGLIDVIRNVVSDGVPFLGVCLGTQIILERSEENGGVDSIGLVPGLVKRFNPSNSMVKIPHMGWNTVSFNRAHALFSEIEDESEFYFIHSYYPAPSNSNYILGRTEYADTVFTSIIGNANLVATQFHPERSGRIGLKMLENFCDWDGSC